MYLNTQSDFHWPLSLISLSGQSKSDMKVAPPLRNVCEAKSPRRPALTVKTLNFLANVL